MRFLSAVLYTTVAVPLLASCSGNGPSPASLVSSGGVDVMPQAHNRQLLEVIPKSLFKHRKFHGKLAPASAAKGILVSEVFAPTNNILGFPKNNSSNGPPVCSLSTGDGVNDFASDSKGNIIVPNGFSGVLIYAPPPVSGACGTLLGTINYMYGQASNAASNDAVNGTIVVGTIQGGIYEGVATCTLSSLTCTALNSPNMGQLLVGVAMDKAGNCYADATDLNGQIGLWYYAGCSGTGTELTSANGFNEPGFGDISVDNHGNLVVISVSNSHGSGPSNVTVYSGCNTGTCTVVGGPFNLQGGSVYGHLGRQNERYVTVDETYDVVEIYKYTGHGTGLTYMYSFNSGLTCATNYCTGAVYQPDSPKI